MISTVTVILRTVIWLSYLLIEGSGQQCEPYPHVFLENGRISMLEGQKLAFKCDSGYFLGSPPVVRCWRRKWTSTIEPRCIKKEGQCEDPPPLANGEIIGGGAFIQYICNPGFVMLGEGQRNCLRSGYWSGITPACIDETEPLQKVAERLREKFVTNLNSSNGSSQEGRSLDSIHNGLELVILIDRSSSIDPKDFEFAIFFVKFLLQEFNVKNGRNINGTRAAVIAFGSKADVLFNLDDETIYSPFAASTALDKLTGGGGGTALEDALTSVFTQLSDVRPGAKKAIFVMTDGEPNIGTPGITPEDVAIQLRGPGEFEIFTMGIGRGINRKLLSGLASPPLLNHVFLLDKYSDLKNIMDLIKAGPSQTSTISNERCGYIKEEKNHLKKWPWLATIYIANNDSLGFCSGTLICSQWVLTAASCFLHNDSQNLVSLKTGKGVSVVMGENNLEMNEKYKINFYATKVSMHPNFSPAKELQDNLALVRLNTPVPLGRYRPACLPPTDKTMPLHMQLNNNASIAGWGLQKPSVHSIDGETIQLQRNTTNVELSEKQECRRITGSSFTDNMLCAGFGQDSCVGDVGSPLLTIDPSTKLHHVLGVLSGKDKCSEGVNHYSELTQYIQWIHKVTSKCHLQHWMA